MEHSVGIKHLSIQQSAQRELVYAPVFFNLFQVLSTGVTYLSTVCSGETLSCNEISIPFLQARALLYYVSIYMCVCVCVRVYMCVQHSKRSAAEMNKTGE